MRLLDRAALDKMVAEATVDCHDEEECVTGFECMMQDELALPFQTQVLGVDVTVQQVEIGQGYDLVVMCRRGKYRQRIRLVDLPLPEPAPKGAEWIEAYRHWLR